MTMRGGLPLAALLLSFVGTDARASYLVEPVLGFHFGRLADSGVSVDMDGAGLGARVGYSLPLFFGALDFNYGLRSREFAGTTIDTPQTSLGIVAGVNVINQFTNEFTEITMKGMGVKLGAGYKVLPMISLNAEYFMNPANELCTSGGTCTDVTADMDFNTFFLSVSAPLSF